jgi:hypothetical protein
MIDPLTAAYVAIGLCVNIAALYTAVKTILASHTSLNKRIDDLVGVVASHQVNLDVIAKDVQMLKTAAVSK